MDLFVGIMSGTSMDALDAVLVDLGHDGEPRHLTGLRSRWPDALRPRLKALAAGQAVDATTIARLDTEVGECIARTVIDLLASASVDPGAVSAIGCHGQTVAHAPGATFPATLQLGNPHLIAERTGITTVGDFRRRDLAAGGQGAPLAPAFHAAFLRDTGENRVVLNLGGIANLTLLPADPEQAVTGFDTGPANCLMDLWIQRQRGSEYDDRGNWAASAQADPELLALLLDDAYFAQQPPKSTGTQYFSEDWLMARLRTKPAADPASVQATLAALTCNTVAQAVHRHAPYCDRVLVCGGGVHNAHLLDRLRGELAIPVESTAHHGIDPDWMEATAFAWLAQRTLSGQAGNLPSVTGARGPRVLGAVHPA